MDEFNQTHGSLGTTSDRDKRVDHHFSQQPADMAIDFGGKSELLHVQRQPDDGQPSCHQASAKVSEPTKTMDFYSDPIEWKTPKVRQTGA